MKNEYINLKIKTDSIKNLNKNKKIYNYGLGILKAILAFLVITVHNFNPRSTKNKTIIFITLNRKLHVPSFYIISFYFMADHLYSLNFEILLKRITRLLIPYIGWPFIFYKLNRFLNIKFNKNLPDSNEELKMQLLVGNRFIFPFWFQIDLIIITIGFLLIIFIFRKNSLFIFQIFFILIYAIEYSKNYHSKYFGKISNRDKNLPFFFLESIPFAISGFILGVYKILDILKYNKVKTFVLSYLIFKIIGDYYIFKNFVSNSYPGINLNIRSICLIFIFSLFPSQNVTNIHLKNLLNIITKYTAGVYYLHVPIHIYFQDYFYNIKKRTFVGLIQDYLICYLICFVGTGIFGKTHLRYLFN